MCDGIGNLLGDAVDFTKSVGSGLVSHLGDIVTPGFDAVLGNPLKGDFMNGDALLTPTGNFSPSFWSQMYNAPGANSDALDTFGQLNQVADKIAPAIAGSYGMSALGSAYGAAGAAGDTGITTGSASAIPTGDAIGSFGGLSQVGADGAMSGSGDALGDFLGQLPSNRLVGSGITSTNSGTASNFFGNLFDTLGSPGTGTVGSQATGFSSSPTGQVIGGLGKLYGGFADYQAAQAARKAYANNVSTIQGLYSPTSPYAQQMQQTLARSDAATGRNSNAGGRAVQLAAALTNGQAQALGGLNTSGALGAANQSSAGLGSLFSGLQGAGSLFSGLKGLFS